MPIVPPDGAGPLADTTADAAGVQDARSVHLAVAEEAGAQTAPIPEEAAHADEIGQVTDSGAVEDFAELRTGVSDSGDGIDTEPGPSAALPFGDAPPGSVDAAAEEFACDSQLRGIKPPCGPEGLEQQLPQNTVAQDVLIAATLPAPVEADDGDGCEPAERVESASAETAPVLAQDQVTTTESGPPRAPSRYRPRLRERSGAAPVSAPSSSRGTGATGSLDADLMILFHPGGWGFDISLLLRRAEGMPEAIAVRTQDGPNELVAIDEAYFEPISLANAAAALLDGLAAESAGAPRRRWVRTGRQLHVFSERPGIPGFASAPRAVIGQENILLCSMHLDASVLSLCEAAGADAVRRVDGPGVPDGWSCFRGYMPKYPISGEGVDELLLALSPLPDAVIELTEGVSVSRSAWIAQRPPVIRIIGSEPADGEVTIDGASATMSGTGWTAAGWDAQGQHVIRYRGLSRSYEIVEVEDSWDAWAAHGAGPYSVCGALVSGPAGQPCSVVPLTGCWLVGAAPGEVVWAPPAVQGYAFAASSFHPVWAIPARTGRTRPAPRLLDSISPRPALANGSAASLKRWRELLRDAAPAMSDADDDRLWQRYRLAARALKLETRR